MKALLHRLADGIIWAAMIAAGIAAYVALCFCLAKYYP